MKKAIIAISIFFLVLTIFLFYLNQNITTAALENSYFYTKAICNESNYCQDYEIYCKGSTIINTKFTGNAVQFSLDWKDPRDEKDKELCNLFIFLL